MDSFLAFTGAYASEAAGSTGPHDVVIVQQQGAGLDQEFSSFRFRISDFGFADATSLGVTAA